MKFKLSSILLATIAVMLVGCNPNKSSNRTSTVRVSSTVGASTSTSSLSSSCSEGVSTYGTIFDYSYYNTSINNTSVTLTGTFENRVKGLLSATISPDEIGSISSYDADSTGVRFQGAVKVSSSGQVTSASSKLYLTVYDSKVIDGSVDSSGNSYSPIKITIVGGDSGVTVSGNINPSTGAGYVIFQDSYGYIRLDGQLVSGYWQGTVSFSNNTTVVSGSSASSGTLGKFYIASCAFIQ